MNTKDWIIIIIVVIALYFLWKTITQPLITTEPFTGADLFLARNVLAYMQTPNNYVGYVKVLIANQNRSINLAKIETYNDFVTKGTNLTIADILSKF